MSSLPPEWKQDVKASQERFNTKPERTTEENLAGIKGQLGEKAPVIPSSEQEAKVRKLIDVLQQIQGLQKWQTEMAGIDKAIQERMRPTTANLSGGQQMQNPEGDFVKTPTGPITAKDYAAAGGHLAMKFASGIMGAGADTLQAIGGLEKRIGDSLKDASAISMFPELQNDIGSWLSEKGGAMQEALPKTGQEALAGSSAALMRTLPSFMGGMDVSGEDVQGFMKMAEDLTPPVVKSAGKVLETTGGLMAFIADPGKLGTVIASPAKVFQITNRTSAALMELVPFMEKSPKLMRQALQFGTSFGLYGEFMAHAHMDAQGKTPTGTTPEQQAALSAISAPLIQLGGFTSRKVMDALVKHGLSKGAAMTVSKLVEAGGFQASGEVEALGESVMMDKRLDETASLAAPLLENIFGNPSEDRRKANNEKIVSGMESFVGNMIALTTQGIVSGNKPAPIYDVRRMTERRKAENIAAVVKMMEKAKLKEQGAPSMEKKAPTGKTAQEVSGPPAEPKPAPKNVESMTKKELVAESHSLGGKASMSWNKARLKEELGNLRSQKREPHIVRGSKEAPQEDIAAKTAAMVNESTRQRQAKEAVTAEEKAKKAAEDQRFEDLKQMAIDFAEAGFTLTPALKTKSKDGVVIDLNELSREEALDQIRVKLTHNLLGERFSGVSGIKGTKTPGQWEIFDGRNKGLLKETDKGLMHLADGEKKWRPIEEEKILADRKVESAPMPGRAKEELIARIDFLRPIVEDPISAAQLDALENWARHARTSDSDNVHEMIGVLDRDVTSIVDPKYASDYVNGLVEMVVGHGNADTFAVRASQAVVREERRQQREEKAQKEKAAIDAESKAEQNQKEAKDRYLSVKGQTEAQDTELRKREAAREEKDLAELGVEIDRLDTEGRERTRWEEFLTSPDTKGMSQEEIQQSLENLGVTKFNKDLKRQHRMVIREMKRHLLANGSIPTETFEQSASQQAFMQAYTAPAFAKFGINRVIRIAKDLGVDKELMDAARSKETVETRGALIEAIREARQVNLELYKMQDEERAIRQILQGAKDAVLHTPGEAGEARNPWVKKDSPEAKLEDILGHVQVEEPSLIETIHRLSGTMSGVAKDTFRYVYDRASDSMRRMGDPGKLAADKLDQFDIRLNQETAKDVQALKELGDKYTEEERRIAMALANGVIEKADVSERVEELSEKARPIYDRVMNFASNVDGMRRKLLGGQKVKIGGSGKYYPQSLNSAGDKALELLKANTHSEEYLARQKQMVASELEILRAERTADEIVSVEQAKGKKKGWDAEWEKIRNQEIRKMGKYESNEAFNVAMRDYNTTRSAHSNYLERPRIILPAEWIEWDFLKTAESHLRSAWRRAIGADLFGAQSEKLEQIVKELKAGDKETGRDPIDPVMVDRYKKFIEREIGAIKPEETEHGAMFAHLVGSYETISKLGFSFLGAFRNAMQPVVNSALVGPYDLAMAFVRYPPLLNRWMGSAQNLKKAMELAGAVTGVTALTEIESGRLGKITEIAMKLFSSVEMANQVRSAYVAMHHVERMLPKLMEAESKMKDVPIDQTRLGKILRWATSPDAWIGMNPEGIRRRLEKMGADQDAVNKALKDGEWTDKALDQIVWKFVRDTQFRLGPSSKRVWQQSAVWRNIFKFKSFSLEQTRMIADHVLDEAAHGNIAPAGRFIVAGIFAGALYQTLRDLLYNRDDSVLTEIFNGELDFDKAVGAMNDSGGFGIASDWVYGASGWLGPLFGTGANALKAVSQSVAQPGMTAHNAVKFLKKEFPVAKQLSGAIEETGLLSQDSMYTVDYTHYRSKARDFAIENNPRRLNRPWIQNAAGDILKVGFKPLVNTDWGPNTSAFNSAVSEIITGRKEAASDFFSIVLEDAQTPQEVEKAVQSIQRAENTRSVLGALPAALRGQFMESLSDKEREKLMEVNTRFHQDWQEAAGMALERYWKNH